MSDTSRQPELSNRFRILVCIDGSPTSYQGLRYALKFNADHEDTDITLLNVRPRSRDKENERLDVDLTSEDNHSLAFDLPELSSLKQARDILIESGFLGEDWHDDERAPAYGQRRGGDIVSFTWERHGQRITMMVRLGSSVLAGILDAASEAPYDIVIVSTGDDEDLVGPAAIDRYTAVSVATEHNGSVILARALEEGHGHMVCITDAEKSTALALKDATIAERCGCPIYLYSVVDSDDALDKAGREIAKVREALRAEGYEITDTSIEAGDAVAKIIEHGQQHSLIVLAATDKSLLKRMFVGSVSHEVLKKAKNSVMIVR